MLEILDRTGSHPLEPYEKHEKERKRCEEWGEERRERERERERIMRINEKNILPYSLCIFERRECSKAVSEAEKGTEVTGLL